MEIDKNTVNNYTKAILTYCLYVLLFLILNKIYFVAYITLFISNILDSCMNNIVSSDMALAFCLMIIVLHIYIYVTAMFCGIFKKINKLKLYEKILIIFMVNMGLYYFCIGRIYGQELYAHVSLLEAVKDYIFWVFPIYFLIYNFFGFLAKKFPFPFGKIGYFTSKEFAKNLFLKLKTRYKP